MDQILAIETSCDETAAAVIADGRVILSNVVASQEAIHAKYGGVFPEVASRQHVLAIVPVLKEALEQARIEWEDLAAVAVTYGPGLAGSLLVGVNAAKGIAVARGLPLVGVNHLEGHVYANWLDCRGAGEQGSRGAGEQRSRGAEEQGGRGAGEQGGTVYSGSPAPLPPCPPAPLPPEPEFPLLCLIVSGGHTDLVLMPGHLQFQPLGSTLDDAAGEAFDKVARLLGLGYPGGPAIQAAALQGVPGVVDLPRAWLRGTYDFSFSGLKTAVLHLVQRANGELNPADVAVAFQESVVDVLVEKTARAAEEFGVKEVLVAGGVAANQCLRERLAERISRPVRYPPIWLCTDNAAMIGAAGYYAWKAGRRSGLDLDVVPSLALM